jgi:tripartite-type tricarboxylate transporter receptor subunit TctC
VALNHHPDPHNSRGDHTMTMSRRAVLALAAAAAVAPARAAGWPERPITIVVPFPPGGSTDYTGRLVAAKLNETFGQSVVVENRSGATGSIGAGAVARSQPDGYTLLVASIAVFAVNPWLQPQLTYDPTKDFDLITVPVRAANVLVANAKFPANSVAELVAALKKEPGKISFASSGAGASDHLAAVLFWQKSGTQGLHVPYRGGAPAINDLIAGHVDVSFQNANAVLEQVRAGKLKALAVTGSKRQQTYPDTPTLTEAGVPGVDAYSWQGFAGPKGLPADVKAKLFAAVRDGFNAPDTKKQLEGMGFEVFTNTPDEFDKFLAAELAVWRDVIRNGNITL